MDTSTPFIVLGSRGTALPVGVRKLPDGIVIGKNIVPWSTQNPKPLQESLKAWVANRGTSLEIYDRNEALQSGIIKAVPVTWQRLGRQFAGTAFVKANWNLQDGQPQYVGIDCADWPHGVIEGKRLGDRNSDTFAILNFGNSVEPMLATDRIPYLKEKSAIKDSLLLLAGDKEEAIRDGAEVEVVLDLPEAGYRGDHIVQHDSQPAFALLLQPCVTFASLVTSGLPTNRVA